MQTLIGSVNGFKRFNHRTPAMHPAPAYFPSELLIFLRNRQQHHRLHGMFAQLILCSLVGSADLKAFRDLNDGINPYYSILANTNIAQYFSILTSFTYFFYKTFSFFMLPIAAPPVGGLLQQQGCLSLNYVS